MFNYIKVTRKNSKMSRRFQTIFTAAEIVTATQVLYVVNIKSNVEVTVLTQDEFWDLFKKVDQS